MFMRVGTGGAETDHAIFRIWSGEERLEASLCPDTGMCEIAPEKSGSVHQCFPFIWLYNGLCVDVAVGFRADRRLLGSNQHWR